MNNKQEFTVLEREEGKRLLSFLKEKLNSEYCRSDLRYAITHHRCQVNGRIERFESIKVKRNDRVAITIEKKPLFTFEKKRLLYEDEHLCIYDKPSGIAVTEKEGLAALLSLLPAHRLDRDTTGALLFAKNRDVLKQLEALFRKREVHKHYLALVSPGPFENEGTIETPLIKVGNKEGIIKWKVGHRCGLDAKTLWKVEKRLKNHALLRCEPITGRTHQIRVHLSSIGHPIVGDIHYGSPISSSFRPLLHAKHISFIHPITNNKISISSPLPDDFASWV